MKVDKARTLLSVTASSTPDEIKKAYRKLALKWHPDKNKDDPTATHKFQEVSAAYKKLTTKRGTFEQDSDASDDEEGAGFDMSESEMFGMFDTMFGDLMGVYGGQVAAGTMTEDELMEHVMLGGMSKMMNEVMGVGGGEVEDLSKEDMIKQMMMGMTGQEMSSEEAGGMDVEDLMAMMSMAEGGGEPGGMLGMEEMMMQQMMGGGGMGGGMPSMPSMPSSAMGGMSMAELREMEKMHGYGMPRSGWSGDPDECSDESENEMNASLVTPEMVAGMSKQDLMMIAMMELEAGREVPAAILMKLGPDAFGDLQGAGMGEGKNAKKNAKKREKAKAKKATGGRFVNKAAGQKAENKENKGSGVQLEELNDYEIDMQVFIPRVDCVGTVKFLGGVHYAKGDWCGVVLGEAKGKNNGTIKGQTYFECDANCGMLVRPNECERVA